MRGATHVLDALLRQAIHEIDIDRVDADSAQQLDRPLHHFIGLHASDRALHVGVEVLRTKADAVDPDGRKACRQLRSDRARVELDGMLAQDAKVESLAQRLNDLLQPLCPKQARRAAAPMQMRYRPSRRGPTQLHDLGPECFDEGVQRRLTQHGLCVATAIIADRTAIGDVQVKREMRVFAEVRQPGGSPPCCFGLEMRRRRIARVARNGAFGED